MYFVYIIYSERTDRYYTGSTHAIDLRPARYNSGWSASTRTGIPWELKYYECFPTRREAIQRELQIKHWKSRTMIRELISSTEPDQSN